MDLVAVNAVELICLVSLAKTFVIQARQNQSVQEDIFNKTPVGHIAFAVNANSAFTGWYTENLFKYQQINIRLVKILRGGHPIVDFHDADECRFFAETMKAMNFQDDKPSKTFDKFKDYYVLL